MRIDKKESRVEVELESERINYNSEWMREKPLITSEGVKYLEKWKIDLIENYGVDRNEL